ncbi:MAG TPA: hypothetical protein PLO37_06775 [Candidatus Hydrogenedentes bacterium]|nr:hypothetical protein [Candidatus Hydrogenedentota bacterium]HPG66535.1 hypothetical protein [Candidatus Hydrogenedentota bacterium]
MDAGEARTGNGKIPAFGHDGVASILAAGVLRLRTRRNLTGTKLSLVSSPETDLISIHERSVHDRRKQR